MTSVLESAKHLTICCTCMLVLFAFDFPTMNMILSFRCFVLKRSKPMADASPGNKASGHYTCDLCGQDGLTDEDMRTHILIEHVEGEVSCPFCDLAGTTAEEMNVHVNAEHLNFNSPSKGSCGSLNPFSNSSVTPSEGSGSSDNGPPSPPVMGRPNVMILSKTVVDDSPSKLSGQQSLKRTRLRLDATSCHSLGSISRTDSTDSDAGSSTKKPNTENASESIANDFTCPMCDWRTTSSDEITRHVNVKHLDLLSPQKPRVDSDNNIIDPNVPSTSTDSGSTFVCPICGLEKDDGKTLERHVNLQHGDVLSLGDINGKRSGDADNNNVSLQCPVCGMEFSDADRLAVHVDGHFSTGQTPSKYN